MLFGLTDKDFELLAKNFGKLEINTETNATLEQYKKYYESETDDGNVKID